MFHSNTGTCRENTRSKIVTWIHDYTDVTKYTRNSSNCLQLSIMVFLTVKYHGTARNSCFTSTRHLAVVSFRAPLPLSCQHHCWIKQAGYTFPLFHKVVLGLIISGGVILIWFRGSIFVIDSGFSNFVNLCGLYITSGILNIVQSQ